MNADPKEYYYGRFRNQFDEWIKKTSAHTHPGEGVYIPIQDLKSENLKHVPQEDYMLFHCALACTVLLDQVIYSHFKKEYREFQRMTLYPKVEYGISNMNVKPWDITHSGIGLTTLERFVNFFVEDIKKFFTDNKFQEISWDTLKSAMLNDPDVIRGSRGEIFKKAIEAV